MKIKQIPEDFIVDEALKLKIYKNKNDYSIIKIKKKNLGTFQLVGLLSRKLGMRQKFIGFAGLKDKNAITTQYISLYKAPKEKINKIKINDAEINFLGYSNHRINLGDLDGNKFIIIIRDLEKKAAIPRNIQLENYFDEQRFGNKQNTHLVGKAILKREFSEACRLLSLDVSNNNYISAIRTHERRLLRFYISSYQSYIWNKTLSEILKNNNGIETDFIIDKLYFAKTKQKNLKIPMLNFDTPKNKIIDKILKCENISRNDFLTRGMPELINVSQDRSAFVNVKNIKSRWGRDELNEGKFKLIISFFLPKGTYATMLIKKILLLYLKEQKPFKHSPDY